MILSCPSCNKRIRNVVLQVQCPYCNYIHLLNNAGMDYGVAATMSCEKCNRMLIYFFEDTMCLALSATVIRIAGVPESNNAADDTIRAAVNTTIQGTAAVVRLEEFASNRAPDPEQVQELVELRKTGVVKITRNTESLNQIRNGEPENPSGMTPDERKAAMRSGVNPYKTVIPSGLSVDPGTPTAEYAIDPDFSEIPRR